MKLPTSLLHLLPARARSTLERGVETLDALGQVRDPRVAARLGPSAVRGMLFHSAKRHGDNHVPIANDAHFDWSYPEDHPELRRLYEKGKSLQWNANDLPWHISVDPNDPDTPLLPEDFICIRTANDLGMGLDPRRAHQLRTDLGNWMLSQFLHGEQGALFASAQVSQAVPFFDGKLYGSTQVMDEARHVEVFHRYLMGKLEKRYDINDNLFVIIDALMRDGRWDVKFLGMQILVEGLALGAFSLLYRRTGEPLLRELLRRVLQDEARHVHYGVLAIKEHMHNLSERERIERENWAFDVVLLMRDRFMAYEVYEEWFEGTHSRAEWRELVMSSPGMEQFREVMFRRLIPNLREVGLMSKHILPAYHQAGLLKYAKGRAATQLDATQLLADLDRDRARAA